MSDIRKILADRPWLTRASTERPILLRAHFSEPMTVAALAKLVHMSASAFHQHFKAVTSLSPVQFQKGLRLQEARRLMLSLRMDVSAGEPAGRVSQRLPVQPGIPPLVRQRADQGHRPIT